MAKNYQLSYIITAIDRASQTFNKVEESLKRIDKSFEKSSAREKQRSIKKEALLTKQLKDRVKDEDRAAKQIETIKKREINSWAKQENRRFSQEKMRTRNSIRMEKQIEAIKKREIDSWAKEENRRFNQEKMRTRNSIRMEKQAEREKQRSIKKEALLTNKKEALLTKQLKDRVKDEDRAAKQIEAIKKREIDSWAKQENRRFSQEKMRTRNSIRMEKQAAREKARIQREYHQNYGSAQNLSRRSMAYVAAPTAAGAVLSLRNTMTIEQMRIRLRTMFGDDGAKTFNDIRQYAAETAFSMQGAANLLTSMKIGAENIGVSKTDELVGLTKNIGNLLLAFTSSPEDRNESIYQLSEIAMSGEAQYKKDIMVLARKGVPVSQAIKHFTGMEMKDAREKFGGNLPAKLIYDALEVYSKLPQVAKAIKEREESLTQGWDTFKEGSYAASGAYGQVLSDTFSINKLLSKSGGLLLEMSTELEREGKLSTEIAKSALNLATTMGITVPFLAAISLTFGKILASLGGAGGINAGWAIFRRHLFMASGVASALYLTTTDWKKVISDINNEGLTGFIKHLDVVAATTLTILAGWNAIKIAAGMGLATKIAAGAGVAAVGTTAIAAGAGYGAWKLGDLGMDKYVDWVDRRQLKAMGIDPTLQDRNRDRMMKEAMVTNKEGDVKVETTVIVDGKKYNPGDYESTSKVTKNPYENPIIYNLGE